MKLFKLKYFFPIIILIFTLLSHGINLFNYPVFLGDEGIYSFQAWWLVGLGKLGPYTYWYDHAPFGWFLLGLWQRLTFGPFSFGFSLNSGRILMVVLASLGSLGIYYLVKNLTKNKYLGLFSSFVFAISPLAIFYHRMILLDNIETFFLIFSLLFLFKAKKRGLYFLLSGIFYGLAFLSKEIVIFLLPSYVLALFWQSKGKNQNYTRFLCLSAAFFIILFLPLLALLRGELFPSAWFGGKEHVSLIETILFQLSRGSGSRPWQPYSYFSQSLVKWLDHGSFLFLAGLWAMIVNLFNFKKDKPSFLFSLFSLNYLLFLARGSFILDFYIIPLLFFFSVNISLALRSIYEEFKLIKKLKPFYPILALVFCFWLGYSSLYLFTTKVTGNQTEVVNYIKNNLPEESVILVDDFAFLDIRLKRNNNDKAFPRVEWYSKAEDDPQIREEELKNDWRNVDFLMIDDYIEKGMASGKMPFLEKVFKNSTLVKEFSSGEEKRGGIRVSLFKVDSKNKGFEEFIKN
ncbi:hypothetical protein COT75_04155 [Candidatus Beckwithbacteria bacterium CG10_big_fil_rev_8_21_14_0_10_34_10]|uniref:Glycosyltransferase RgtA/B/C/D-like domain-containing protein n=1 Tax=Candidatus Beckwithbacteria bacterium CG10_big_fil_rev_8_21_14_0_10_34_10 TaxID=1974495 RepID=A0A2H0W8L7_9BACT|nr:MAG: hypothetical protein COT75_04155 [Candidatus Beckwithbacteria bacterium CG10_big_fil_rev_8_21_14_0_10_34_10]